MNFDRLVAIDVQLNSRTVNLIKISDDLLDCFVQIGFAVLILHVTYWHVDFVFWSEVNTVLILRDFVGNLCSADY